MSDTFEKIRKYYSQFDEWGRLDSPAGILEKSEVIRIVSEYVPKDAHILDLGSGPGRYAIEFAKRGYNITLIDISERLIAIAREKFEEYNLSSSVRDFMVANTTNLPELTSESYDAIFSCGPFYHLVKEKDRINAAKEAFRVCKPGGTILIGFIPRFSGLAGLIYRGANSPGQVNSEVFEKAAKEGVFQNAIPKGFQEGYYPTVKQAKEFWTKMGLTQIEVLSTRTFIHQNEAHLMKIRKDDPPLFETIVEASRKYARSEAFIEAGGHALLIGKKKSE